MPAADVAEGCLPVAVALLLLAEEEFGADREFFVVREVAQLFLNDLADVAALGQGFGDGAVDAIACSAQGCGALESGVESKVVAVFPFALADDVIAVVVRVRVGRVLLDRFEVIFGPAAGDLGDRFWLAARFGGVEPEHVLEHFRGEIDDSFFVVEMFVHRGLDITIDVPA